MKKTKSRNILQKVLATILATTMLTSSIPTTAFAGNFGNTSTSTPDIVQDITGGATFTNIKDGGTDITVDGIYTYQDDDSFYMLFTNKKASNSTFYRTVGFSIAQNKNSRNDASENTTKLAIPNAYKDITGVTSYISSTEGLGNNIIVYDSPGSTISSNNPSTTMPSTHYDEPTTTTCFKISLNQLDTYLQYLGQVPEKNADGSYTIYLNAIQVFAQNSKYTGNVSYTYSSSLNSMINMSFSERSQKSLETYYEIPITIPPRAYNAITAIDVSGGAPIKVGTAWENLTNPAPDETNFFDYQRVYGNSTDFANRLNSGYKVVGMAVVPYGTFGFEERELDGSSKLVTKMTDNRWYYDAMPTSYAQNYMVTYLNSKFGTKQNAGKAGVIATVNSNGESWLYQGSSDSPNLGTNCYKTGLSLKPSSIRLTNTHNKCGTQVYLFVIPDTTATDTNANLVFYNDATGEALATGTIDYEFWQNSFDGIVNGDYRDTPDNDGTSNPDTYYELKGAGDHTSFISSINNINLTDTSSISNMSANYRAMTSGTITTSGTSYTRLKGKTEVTPLQYGYPSVLMTKFPSTLKTKSGQKLIFKGVEAKFDTTVSKDITDTRNSGSGALGAAAMNTLANAKSNANITPIDGTSNYNFTFDGSSVKIDSLFDIYKGVKGKFISDSKTFVFPTIAVASNNWIYSVGENYKWGVTFANRYTIANLPWYLKLNYTGSRSKTYNLAKAFKAYSAPFDNMTGDATLLYSESNESSAYSFTINEELSNNVGKIASVNKVGTERAYHTLFDMDAGATTSSKVQSGSTTITTLKGNVDFDNVTTPTSKYIIRAVYEPASVPVLYYYKNQSTNQISLMYMTNVARTETTTVKSSVTVDGKKYYTSQTSYREGVTADSDITNTIASDNIMVDGLDKEKSSNLVVNLRDIYTTDKDYVIRVELTDQPETVITAPADYEIGTFKIGSQYLNRMFTYNSTDQSLQKADNESTQINSDNYISKTGVLANPTTTEYGDAYNNTQMVTQALWSKFNHNNLLSLYKAHNNGSSDSGYESNVDGNPLTGAVTKYYEEESGDETRNVATPCKQTNTLVFTKLATKWDNDVEDVFGTYLNSPILYNSSTTTANPKINEMGGRSDIQSTVTSENTGSDAMKATPLTAQFVFGSILTKSATDSDGATLNDGIVKANLGFTFSSARSLFDESFKPVLASYALTNEQKQALTDAGLSGTYTTGNIVENTYYVDEQHERFVAGVYPSDDEDAVQTYNYKSNHETDNRVDDKCDNESESNEELTPYELTRGNFGGYVVSDATAKVSQRTPVSAPNTPEGSGYTPVDTPVIMYPNYPMIVETPNGGETSVPVLSPTPIVAKTNVKISYQGDIQQQILSLQAVLTRGKQGTLAAGSAFQYIANGHSLERSVVIDYLYARPEYVANASEYNGYIDTQLEEISSKLGKKDNYSVNTVSNIPFATGTVDRYKVTFNGLNTFNVSDDDPTTITGDGSLNYLLDGAGINDAMYINGKDKADHNIGYSWYTESFPITSAFEHRQKVIKVTCTLGNSNTAVAHLQISSNSDKENVAPNADNVVANNVLPDSNYLIQRGPSKPYKFGTSVMVTSPVAAAFGTNISLTMYTTPVYFKVEGTAYDYRE